MTTRSSGADFRRDDLDGMILRLFQRGAGRSHDEVRRGPVIGICSTWSELNPCNLGLRGLAAAVKRGVIAAGGLPLEFPTISLAEPYVKPTTLFLRNLMAMDVEEMIAASPIDAVVLLGGCDKTVPAQLMGALSAGKPAVALVAGPRPTADWRGEVLAIDDLWPLADRRRDGSLSEADWVALEGELNPGIGTCNVMGTATTMAVVAEVLGMTLPGTSLLPATGAARRAAAEETGARAVALAGAGTPPSAFVTRAALENAVRAVAAVGGSTNAVIHLEAIAGRVGERLGLDRIGELSDTTPLLTAVRPSGPALLADLQQAGGVPSVLRELAPLLHLDALAGTGRPWRAVIAEAAPRGGGALRPLDDPVAASGGLAVLRGTLAPDGAILKRSAATPGLLRHRGPALVFDGLGDLRARIDDPALAVTPETVLILRGVGPVGGPGMPEVGQLPIPAKLLRAGVRDMVRISDARMSGTAAGTVVLHVAPEAAVGGPLALVRDGDEIVLDTDRGLLDLRVDPHELERRRAAWQPGPPPARGYDRLHHRHVLQAPEGCDLDFLRAAVAPTPPTPRT
jgi:dihydroxy-acid dehydratase